LTAHVVVRSKPTRDTTPTESWLQYAQKGMKPVIQCNPTRKHKRRLNRKLYRVRYLVELFIHRIKRFRAVATRYEKTARNYLALVQLVCAFVWLS
jgi:transposase